MTSLHDSHKGAWAELQAASWLLRQGYEVCRNVSQCGPVDLVAIRRDGKMFLIDVKTQKPLVYGSGATKLTPLQQEMGVRLLFVSPRGICIWATDLFSESEIDWPTMCPFCEGHPDDRMVCRSAAGLARHVATHERTYEDALLALIGGFE